MHRTLIIRYIFSLFFSLVSLSPFLGFNAQAEEPGPQTPSAQELYLAGVKAYQSSKFAEASESFRAAFAKAPQNRAVLFNWGLAEYKQSHFGMAAATWRRALALDPDYSVAEQALAVVKQNLPSQHSAEEPSFFETFRSVVLVKVSGPQLAVVTAILLFFSGWLLLKFLGQRRRALENEQRLPHFPTVGVALFALFLVSAVTSLSKIYDFVQPRATVVTTSASVFSGPSDSSPSLFELSEGFEVIMNRDQGNWRQITSPGGLSGWVKQEVLFQTSGSESLGLTKW